MLDMVTIGDIKLDTFVVLDEASLQCQLKMPECLLCLEYGKKIPVRVVDSQIAGSAPNVATGLSRLGYKTAVLSNMGVDGTRTLAMKRMKEEGVGTQYIHVSKNEPSAYSVVLNFKEEKTILTSHIKHVYRIPQKFTKPKWLYLSEMGPGYEHIYRDVLRLEKKDGVLIGCNPGTIQIEEGKQTLFDLLRHVYVLFVNLEEARAISGENTLEVHRLATALWKLGPKKVVITDGKNGSYSFDGQELHFCPIFPGTFVEATGAGDAFATGYMAALMSGELHDEALRWGAVNSTSVVGFVGPTAGLLGKKQIVNRLRQHPGFNVELM